MLLAASVGEDILRAVLQGLPPGTVYALVALGLRPHLQDVGGVQLRLRRAGLRVGRDVLPGPGGVGLGHRPRADRLGVPAGAGARAVPRAGDLQPPPHRPRSWPSWSSPSGSPSPSRRIYRRARRLRGRRSAARPTGIVPDGDSVFYDPFGVYRFSRNELVAMVVAVAGMVLLGADLPLHLDRPAHASGRREPADDRAERHPRRSGVGLQLGAVEPLRRDGRRAHRAVVQHAVATRTSSTSSWWRSPPRRSGGW